MSGGAELGPGREFDIVRALLARWGPRARGLGDDAALLVAPAGEELVVSTDSSVEGVHFRREWLAPDEIGWRAAMAALSDLAAMAARPLGVLLALTVPDRWRGELGALADGIGEAVGAADTVILGGDLSRGSDLVLAITVLGATAAPLRRGGARPADTLYLTGTLGGPGAALAAWISGQTPSAPARERFARPRARLGEARWLAEHGARAAIDLSDGLLADAAHMAAASACRLLLDVATVPAIGGVDAIAAARSGEEYELLVAAPHALDSAAFAREFGIPLTAIGRVEQGAADVIAMRGHERVASGGGWDHFS